MNRMVKLSLKSFYKTYKSKTVPPYGTGGQDSSLNDVINAQPETTTSRQPKKV